MNQVRVEGVSGDLAKRRLEEQAEDCQNKYGVRVRLRFEQPDHGGGGAGGGGGVKVNFLARCGQKSDLSGLCGIGYWVWIISTAHCKQPILIGY